MAPVVFMATGLALLWLLLTGRLASVYDALRGGSGATPPPVSTPLPPNQTPQYQGSPYPNIG